MNRKEKILELLKEGDKSVKDLAKFFNVSLMTVYRDIKELEQEGKLIKKNRKLIAASPLNKNLVSGELCAFCKKTVESRLAYIIYTKKRVIQNCCPHCGLLVHSEIDKEEIESAVTKDFITSNLLSAMSAFYVVNSNAIACCAPSVLAFSRLSDAESFKKGFGGEVCDFENAIRLTKDIMKYGNIMKISGKIK